MLIVMIFSFFSYHHQKLIFLGNAHIDNKKFVKTLTDFSFSMCSLKKKNKLKVILRAKNVDKEANAKKKVIN
jgi:hypothetical protein